ncbi:MAG: hypothetical protein KC420_02135, partial [Myxococcales bacterium]|nr:hypothetical protein [Myxococcales bacterium]
EVDIDGALSVPPVVVGPGSPVVVGSAPSVVEVVAGEQHFCARDVDGAVTCWGADDRGQLGRLPAAVHLELTPLLLPSAAP